MQGFNNDLKEAFVLINQAHNRAVRERSDLQQKMKCMDNEIDALTNRQDSHGSSLTKLALFLEQGLLQETLKFHMDQQDEQDRSSIALYGVDGPTPQV
jgi:hypothetical protein